MDTLPLSWDLTIVSQLVARGVCTKKGENVPSIKLGMATSFWDCQGIFVVDHLETDETITGAHNAS